MPRKRGLAKTGGRKAGVPNKRTQQWEMFVEHCMTGGLEKFKKELEKLNGKNYVDSFLTLLEFHQPKLQRTEGTLSVNELPCPIIK